MHLPPLTPQEVWRQWSGAALLVAEVLVGDADVLRAEQAHSGLPNAPTGGIVFTKYFWDVMQAHGENGIGIQYMLARGMPSFAAWIEPGNPHEPAPSYGPGATTLWVRVNLHVHMHV